MKPYRKKLTVGAHVEVRSTEDGFHGSWHSGTVVNCGDLVREVRYNNLLVDDGSENLVESVNVSFMIDGEFPINGVPVNYRGTIRPVPPPLEIDRWGFHYGLCVDAYVNDAWWEGVVFDYEAGAEERSVFFPDLGDEQTVEIGSLRVTRDWDEVSERWIERGDWLFVRLIEEQEKELFFCASVKQLWYDARAKEDFRMIIKEWTCWIRPMWDEIVREVIWDDINLLAKHLFSVVESESRQISVESWNNSTSSDKSDTTLQSEGSSQDDQILGPSKRSKRARSRSGNEPGNLQDNVEGSRFAFSSSDTMPPCKRILQDDVDEDPILSSLRGPSRRTGSCTDNSDFTLPCNGILQDNVGGNQLMKSNSKCGTTPPSNKGVLQDSVNENCLLSTLKGSIRRRGRANKSDVSTLSANTLPSEGIVQDNVEESHLAMSLLGPSERRTRSTADEGILQDHVEKNQRTVSPSGQSQTTCTNSDTSLSCDDVLQHNVDENQLVLSSPSASKRRGSTDSYYSTRWYEDSVQDNVEENQIVPEEPRLKRKSNSSSMHSLTKKVKGSFEPNSGGQVDERAALRFQIVRNSNGGTLAIKGNLGVLPMKRSRKSDPDDLIENEDCDSEALFSDPNLFSQINSVSHNRENHKDDILNGQEGMVIQDALGYLRIARDKSFPREPLDKKNVVNKVRMHLLDMGWEIKHGKWGRVLYITPNGRIFYTLTKVCETLTEAEEIITTPCSQNANGSLVDSLNANVQQVTSPEFQQNCISEGCGATPLGKATVLNPFKSKTGPTGGGREEPMFDMSETQGGRIVQDALLNYLCFARAKSHMHGRKSAVNEAQMCLLDLGWKIKRIKGRNQFRTYYNSPEGKHFNSLAKVCENLRTGKEMITTHCSQNNNSLVNSSAVSLGTNIQQAAFQEILQQHSVSEGYGATPLSKAMASDHCKTKAGPTGGSPPLSEILAPTVEPACNRKDVVEHYGRGNIEENMAELCFDSRNNLSLSGWAFRHISKNVGNGLHCTSSLPNYKVYSSLQTAREGCMELGLSEGTRSMQGNTMDEEYKDDRTHCNLTNETSKYLLPWRNCTDMSGLSKSKEFKLGSIKVGVRGSRKRPKRNSWPFTSMVNSTTPYTRAERLVSCTKTQGDFDQNPSSSGQRKQNSVRASNRKGDKLDGSYPSRVLRSHKRARRVIASNPEQFTPRTILWWLIDNNVVLPREKVYYKRKNHQHPMAEGRITRDGIKCNCCQTVFGLSSFEAHAGSPHHSPAENIFLEDGRSLLDCQKELLQKTNLTDCKLDPYNKLDDKNDSICSVCRYGGMLLLCDWCPSSFHLSCIGLERLPKGKWFCPACRCAICGLSNFNEKIDKFTENSVLYCDQCERQYHVGCSRKKRAVKFHAGLKENRFCSDICEKIFMGLHRLLGKSIAVGMGNLSWTMLKFSEDHVHKDASSTVTMVEHHSKLNVALAVMHECFEPIQEPQTDDLVKDVLFNRRSVLKRLDFRGFYTVLLEKEDELVSVATVRIYGGKVAEVPLIGTRFHYRRQGMCRVLMDLLEKKLAQIGVERLLLPAIPQLLQSWTTSFGFSKMTLSERLKFLEYTFLDFQGTTMCQKLLKNVVTLKVIGPKERDEHDVAAKVARKNEKSALKQMSVNRAATHDRDSAGTLSRLDKSTQQARSNYNNKLIERDGKQKEDKGSEKMYALKYYRRQRHGQHSCVSLSVV